MLLSQISIILACSICTLVNSIMQSVWQRRPPGVCAVLLTAAVVYQSQPSAELLNLLRQDLMNELSWTTDMIWYYMNLELWMLQYNDVPYMKLKIDELEYYLVL